MYIYISKAFDRVWHASPFHKLKSYRIPGCVFGLTLSFRYNRWLLVVLYGKNPQEYPVNAKVCQDSILDL